MPWRTFGGGSKNGSRTHDEGSLLDDMRDQLQREEERRRELEERKRREEARKKELEERLRREKELREEHLKQKEKQRQEGQGYSRFY